MQDLPLFPIGGAYFSRNSDAQRTTHRFVRMLPRACFGKGMGW